MALRKEPEPEIRISRAFGTTFSAIWMDDRIARKDTFTYLTGRSSSGGKLLLLRRPGFLCCGGIIATIGEAQWPPDKPAGGGAAC
jgi:hypothetical protein